MQEGVCKHQTVITKARNHRVSADGVEPVGCGPSKVIIPDITRIIKSMLSGHQDEQQGEH